MAQNQRRKKFIGTSLQKKLLILIFASAVIPTGFVAAFLYYLIFNTLARQIGVPGTVLFDLTPVLQKVNMIILLSVPLILLAIWVIALEVSNRIAGPVYRLEKELDAVLSGQTRGPINLRKDDELKPLTGKINKLLSKMTK